MQPSQPDMILHALSLQIAATYHSLNRISLPSMDDEALQDIILAYRSIRRHIGKGKDGKRFGSNEAHRMMQGRI
jgi:hypothetical protein